MRSLIGGGGAFQAKTGAGDTGLGDGLQRLVDKGAAMFGRADQV
jgi:hypothetical protein